MLRKRHKPEEIVAKLRQVDVLMAQGTPVADEPDLAWRDGAQAVVQGRKVQALQVRDVARDVKGHDLALAGQGHLVAADKALKDKAAPGRAIALAHDVLVGPDGLNLHGQVEKGLPLLGREVGDAFQLAHERVLVGCRGHGWLLRLRREHTPLSAIGARNEGR